MADDKKNPEEYEYPSEEYYKGGEYIPPDDSADNLEPTATRGSFLPKRVLLLLGLLVATGLVYLFVSFTNSRRAAQLAAPVPAVDTASATIPSTPTTPVQVAPPVVPQAPAPSDAALQQMAQQNQLNQQSVASMQNQIQQLQSQVNDMTNSISTLNSQLQVIVNELRAISIDRSLRGRNAILTTTGTAYHLKALVPGRAWLQSKEGHSTTVTIGDRLPGYGIIQMINVPQGIVTTSSGAIIQYGPKDS